MIGTILQVIRWAVSSTWHGAGLREKGSGEIVLPVEAHHRGFDAKGVPRGRGMSAARSHSTTHRHARDASAGHRATQGNDCLEKVGVGAGSAAALGVNRCGLSL